MAANVDVSAAEAPPQTSQVVVTPAHTEDAPPMIAMLPQCERHGTTGDSNHAPEVELTAAHAASVDTEDDQPFMAMLPRGEDRSAEGDCDHAPPLVAALPCEMQQPDPKRDAADSFEEELCCPITQARMVDPVVTADGHSYERAAIVAWLARSDVSPLTNMPLLHKELVPNHALRSLCLLASVQSN